MAADGDILAALVHLGGPGAHGVDQIANTVRLINCDGCDPTEDASGHVLATLEHPRLAARLAEIARKPIELF